MRTEVRLDALESKMDAKFAAIDAKIDAIYWILSGVIALNLFMLGFMIWDPKNFHETNNGSIFGLRYCYTKRDAASRVCKNYL